MKVFWPSDKALYVPDVRPVNRYAEDGSMVTEDVIVGGLLVHHRPGRRSRCRTSRRATASARATASLGSRKTGTRSIRLLSSPRRLRPN